MEIVSIGLTLVWLLAITLLRWSWHGDLLLLWLGGIIGSFLPDLDRILLKQTTEPVFHGQLFQIALVFFSLFVLTSTDNLFIAGLVLGMLLHLLKETKSFVILKLVIFLGLNLFLI